MIRRPEVNGWVVRIASAPKNQGKWESEQPLFSHKFADSASRA
jgi:hypothetical protein